MNSLSWLIYLMQVSDGIRTFCGIASVLLLTFGGGGLILFHVIVIADDIDEGRPYLKTARRAFFGALIPMLVLAAILPSRQTLLLIAGSEIGERFVKSNEVREVVNPGVDLLKTWIKKETARLNGSS